MTFCGRGWAWLTGWTAGGWATTLMARSPLSLNVGALTAEAGELPPLACPDGEGAPVPAGVVVPVRVVVAVVELLEGVVSLFELMLLNIEPPVSVEATDVRPVGVAALLVAKPNWPAEKLCTPPALDGAIALATTSIDRADEAAGAAAGGLFCTGAGAGT